jgi:hypothetical protein
MPAILDGGLKPNEKYFTGPYKEQSSQVSFQMDQ